MTNLWLFLSFRFSKTNLVSEEFLSKSLTLREFQFENTEPRLLTEQGSLMFSNITVNHMTKTTCQKTLMFDMTRQVNNLRRLWQVLVLFITTIITFQIINMIVVHNAWRTCFRKVFEPPFIGLLWGIMWYRWMLSFGWNYLFIHWVVFFWFNFYTIVTYFVYNETKFGQLFAKFSQKCCHYSQNLSYYITLDSDFEVSQWQQGHISALLTV